MASILQLAAAPFRTRSPARDARTDHQRLDAIRSSITDAIESAKQEQQGPQPAPRDVSVTGCGPFPRRNLVESGERSAAEEQLFLRS